MQLGSEVCLGPGDIMLDGEPAPQKRHSPQFSTHVYCNRPAVCIMIPLGTKVGLSLGDVVLDGYPAISPLKGHSPHFSANVRCGQTAGWTKMPLGMVVSSDFVFDGDPAPLRKRMQHHPVFGPCLLWPNGWTDQDATWYTEVNIGPGNVVLDGVAASHKRDTHTSFGPMSITAKRLDG